MEIEEMVRPEEFFRELKARFAKLLKDNGIETERVRISAKGLSAEEAIGVTERKDFPILAGKEVMLHADCCGAGGQAFTDAPSEFSGTLKELSELDIENDTHARGLFIAALNAVMKYLGKAECTVHCKNEGPEKCAADVERYIRERYGAPKIVLIGYQPAMLERLSKSFKLRVFDLNPQNIGEIRYGVRIENGNSFNEAVQDDADLILCTGSTVCNGTIVNFLGLKKETLFYGTSLAGTALLMGLPRICFADKYQ